MNNAITDDLCSFEVSKLLQDKGFDCLCHGYFFGDKTLPTYARNSMYNNDKIMRPSQSLALKWVRENFGVHISIFPGSITNTEMGDLKDCKTYYGRIDNRWNLAHTNDGKNVPYKDYIAYTKYESWEEATNATLSYVLKHLNNENP